VIDEGTVTVMVVEPDLVESCVEVAVMVAAPALFGLKIPALLTDPMLDGLTDHVMPVLKFPIPATVGVHVEVCAVEIDAGEQTTETEVIVDAIATVMVADPDLVVSCVEVAVIVAVPAPLGVKMPALPMDPILVGLTDHATAEL
jgi:hypothetical protein